jgi:hypothetical protein
MITSIDKAVYMGLSASGNDAVARTNQHGFVFEYRINRSISPPRWLGVVENLDPYMIKDITITDIIKTKSKQITSRVSMKRPNSLHENCITTMSDLSEFE